MHEPWRNLFVVGAAESGIASLAYYLAGHPDIALTREDGALPLTKAPARFQGTLSTAWFWSPQAPEDIAAVAPDARIIAVLPGQAAVPDAEPPAVAGACCMSSAACAGRGLYVECGLFSRQLENYLNVFAPEQILVVHQEDLGEQPRAVLEVVLDFLGLEPRAGLEASLRAA